MSRRSIYAWTGTGRYYVCGSQIYRDGVDCGKPWYIRRDDAEDAAFKCVEMVLASDKKHTLRIVDKYNKWLDSQLALYSSSEKARVSEIDRLQEEIRNLTHSLAAGVAPITIRAAINERASHIERLQQLVDVDLPKKITGKELDEQVKEVVQIAKSRDTDRKRSALRKYIAAIKADPEERILRVSVNSINSLCGHSLVAPKGFDEMTTFEVVFKGKSQYTISVIQTNDDAIPQVA